MTEEQELYPEPIFATIKAERINTHPVKGDILVAIVDEIPWGLKSTIKLNAGSGYKVLYGHYMGVVLEIDDKRIAFNCNMWKRFFRKAINNSVKIS